MADFVVEDRWSFDSGTGLWTCGELVIGLEANDPTRWYVKTAADAGDERLFDGSIPPEPHDWDSFVGHFNYRAEAEVTEVGLEPWFEQAQALAQVEYDLIESERLEMFANIPGRTAAELLAQPDTTTDWLVPGFIKRGWATKIGGREKTAGKGTLVLHLLGKLERGEETVFGLAAERPVTALIFRRSPTTRCARRLRPPG